MQTVFHTLPWIMPEEPASIQRFFRKEGTVRKYGKGQLAPHGTTSGVVSMVKRGTLIFYFLNYQSQQETFSLSLPGRTLGDLELFTDNDTCFALAECSRATELYVVSRERFKDFLMSSIDLMRDYAVSANRKHWCAMEGMIANYTLPLEIRLVKFLYSVSAAFYTPKTNDWNPLPVQLTVTDMAKFISGNRSWVSHTLNRWVGSGLIRRDGRFLIIHGDLFGTLTQESDAKASPAASSRPAA